MMDCNLGITYKIIKSIWTDEMILVIGIVFSKEWWYARSFATRPLTLKTLIHFIMILYEIDFSCIDPSPKILIDRNLMIVEIFSSFDKKEIFPQSSNILSMIQAQKISQDGISDTEISEVYFFVHLDLTTLIGM